MEYGHMSGGKLEHNNEGQNEDLYLFPGIDLLGPELKTDVKDKPGCKKK